MGNSAIIKKNRPTVRVVKATDHVQQRRLPGPIGPNHRDNFAVPDLHTHLANSLDATELLGNALNPAFSLSHHARASCAPHSLLPMPCIASQAMGGVQ